MKNYLTKKNILITSALISLLLFVFDYLGTYKMCGQETGGGTPFHWLFSSLLGSDCVDSLYNLIVIFLPFFPVFFFSLITYKLREEIYTTWFNFARWWIPLSMFFVLVAPLQSHDWMFPIDKGRVSFFMSLFFVLISLILITYKHFTLKKSGSGK